MEIGSSPRNVTSKRRIKYRQSAWNVHEFEVWSGELVCRVSALQMEKSLMIWVGGREAHLSEFALGMPMSDQEGCRSALATVLLGEEGAAARTARRLAFTLAKPAFVCYGRAFDRFTLPLVERGIVTEIKTHPEHF